MFAGLLLALQTFIRNPSILKLISFLENFLKNSVFSNILWKQFIFVAFHHLRIIWDSSPISWVKFLLEIYKFCEMCSLNGSVFRILSTIYHGTFRKTHRRCSVKKDILKISQNSQENTCARVSFLIKLQANTFFTEHLLTTTSTFSPTIFPKGLILDV